MKRPPEWTAQGTSAAAAPSQKIAGQSHVVEARAVPARERSAGAAPVKSVCAIPRPSPMDMRRI
ncbi:hypothetical protein Pmi06nite_50700 [Planotetraspora mira]|uniref:Uncharacterized protein n=1 Tax=Planotetraspora mira TaxID=58121 RepID=A0A8J3TR76_9ACTN|nr:hypothetical protein Pmi06nite_50700 [Planotetraspora mira]